MLQNYLGDLDDFKSIPFYELDWESLDPTRVSRPEVKVRTVSGLATKVKEIAEEYRSGNGEIIKNFKNGTSIQSKEAVFYMNSINAIIRCIRACEMKPDEVNIICAKTKENEKRIRQKLGKSYIIGKVPLPEGPRKMFTFCTRTVYLGADFYSDNAKSYIFSDSGIESMCVDISLDLPQIMGRQRLMENPWRNYAELFIIFGKHIIESDEEFEGRLNRKLEATDHLISIWGKGTGLERFSLSGKFEESVLSVNYKNDYVTLNKHIGKIPVPEVNNLLIVSERRMHDIMKLDYADQFSVFSRVSEVLSGKIDEMSEGVRQFMKDYGNCSELSEKLRLFMTCQYITDTDRGVLINLIDGRLRQYTDIDLEILRKCGFYLGRIDKYMKKLEEGIEDDPYLEDIKELVYQEFKEGQSYSRDSLKQVMSEIYKTLGIPKTGKSSDFGKYFELKACKIKDQTSGKWLNGFELGKKK